jgi:guanylate kinase
VINDDFQLALADLRSIISSERLRLDPQQQTQSGLLAELLA